MHSGQRDLHLIDIQQIVRVEVLVLTSDELGHLRQSQVVHRGDHEAEPDLQCAFHWLSGQRSQQLFCLCH